MLKIVTLAASVFILGSMGANAQTGAAGGAPGHQSQEHKGPAEMQPGAGRTDIAPTQPMQGGKTAPAGAPGHGQETTGAGDNPNKPKSKN